MWIETCGNEVSIHVETESDISEAKHYIDTFDSTGDRYVTVVVDGEYMLFDASFPDTVFAIECENVHAVFRGGKHVEIHADNTFVKLFDSCTAETCDTGMYDDDSYAHVELFNNSILDDCMGCHTHVLVFDNGRFHAGEDCVVLAGDSSGF